MRWPAERSDELLEGLLRLARAAMVSSTPERVPGVVSELMEALQSQAISVDGSAARGSDSLEGMGTGVAADAAGLEVGLTGARVRQLCRAGRVRHQVIAGRYLVDVDDLRRHMGRAS